MRTAQRHDHGRSPDDLTARAKVRDAAIDCFSEQGFSASFRTIAQRADVSPGLITHHFGSKQALRAECDIEVLRRYRALKGDSLAAPSAALLQQLSEPGPAPQLMIYMLRAIHAGGRPAEEFLEHLVDSARASMAAAVESGLIRPSRDEDARVRWLTYQSLGAMLIQFLTTPDPSPETFFERVRARERGHILPTLEVFAEGLLTSRQLLDDYVDYVDASSPQPS